MKHDLNVLKSAAEEGELPDFHRNPPKPNPAALYGLIGEIAWVGSRNSEANPYAIALNMIAFIGTAVGRGPYLQWGDTVHHARLFTMHVGRSSVARKGDATSLMHRIEAEIRRKNLYLCPQVHRGGLSTREGLTCLIHYSYDEGKTQVPGVDDKRLLVVESEFANVLHQGKRDGNTLSAALRDCWDGVDLKPASKQRPIWASNPHIALMGAITPSELTSLIAGRDLLNGFFNRFLVIVAERTCLLAFPQPTSKEEVAELADRVAEVIQFCKGQYFTERDHMPVVLSDEAVRHYERLYLGELNDNSMGERIAALVQRRAPMTLRLAMLFALCDLSTTIDTQHLNAAMAWIHYSVDSVKYIFATGAEEIRVAEVQADALKIVEFLREQGLATRTAISTECFGGHKTKQEIDAAIDELLGHTPPTIVVDSARGATGRLSKSYRLSGAKPANSAKFLVPQEFSEEMEECESGEFCEVRNEPLLEIRKIRKSSQAADAKENAGASKNSPISLNSHVTCGHSVSLDVDFPRTAESFEEDRIDSSDIARGECEYDVHGNCSSIADADGVNAEDRP